MEENPYRAPRIEPFTGRRRGVFAWLRQQLGLPPTPPRCSYCGIHWGKSFPFVEYPGEVYICRRCVVICSAVMDEAECAQCNFDRVIYHREGELRVVFFRNADETYGFREERLWCDEFGAPFWAPARAPDTHCDTLDTAIREAATRITWWNETPET